MPKRLLCWLLCLALLLPAAAMGEDISTMTEILTYDAGDAVGSVVEPTGRPDADAAMTSRFVNEPLDVVLIIDSSGSMATGSALGKQLISYAQDAAVYFAQTLFAINSQSRVGVVQYDSYASEVSEPRAAEQQNALYAAIRGIYTGGTTNLGGGFDAARAMLGRVGRPEAKRVYVMLTDGLANEGRDPISAGWDIRADGLVYTVGLLGGMSASEKQEARRVLNAGYENRYFEIDFGDIADIDSQLAQVFMTIAAASCAPDDGACSAFRISVDSRMDVYVTDGSGEYLSSAPEDFRSRASFGFLAMTGNNMEEKTVMLARGQYSVRLRGQTSGQSTYAVTRIQGYGIAETELLRRTEDAHPALVKLLSIDCSGVTVTDQSWEPLDLNAVDPFTGRPTRGLEYPAAARLGDQARLRSLPDPGSLLIATLDAGAHVNVLAQDPYTGWYFVQLLDEYGLLTRGWVPGGALSPRGYVPLMIWAPPAQFSLPAGTMNRRAPAEGAAPASVFSAPMMVTRLHAERDAYGREWAYLRVEGLEKPEAIYVPADQIPGWQTAAPERFRLGYATPAFLFQRFPQGNGFTEFMWAAAQTDGTGTVLSGRTSSTAGQLVARGGGRDAMAILMDPYGNFENIRVSGGSELDSYHCILPEGDHYFVAGVTRSNNKDFAGIWDTLTYTGTPTATSKRANALIGRLDANFNIQWMKSFGVGSTPFGFDVVIELADGTLAGCGWLNANKASVVPGFGHQDFFMVKMSKEGQLLDIRNFGGGIDDIPDSAVATPDGGFIMVGMSNSDGLIIIVDRSLNVVRSITYGGSGQDTFDNIRDLGNGTYLVTGFTESGSRGEHDFWAMVIDGQGRAVWSKTYGGSGDEELCGTTILPGGRYLLLGSTMSSDGDIQGGRGVRGYKDAWAICIDETGRLLWQFTGDLAGNDRFNAAAIDPADGGIVMVGLCDNSDDNRARGYIVKVIAP